MMTFVIFSTSMISSFTTQVISWVKILSFHPEDSFLKVLVTFRAQNRMFKSKHRDS